jgi:chromosome segregation ATPase
LIRTANKHKETEKTMNEKELYRRKRQAQLDEWKADVDKLKARASGASADAQLELNAQIKALKAKIDEGKAKLSALAAAGEDSWETLKDGVESAWGSLKSAMSEATARFKK